MSSLLSMKTTAIISFALVLGVIAAPSHAQVVPFKIDGSGNILSDLFPAPGAAAAHTSTGQATHMGRYNGLGIVKIETINLATGEGTFSSDVPYVFEATNGDRLVFQYGRTDAESGASPAAAEAGKVKIVPAENGQVKAVWDAEFNPVPELCTGRFANVVSGSFRMIATTDPFDFGPLPAGLGYSWVGEGKIDLGKKK